MCVCVWDTFRGGGGEWGRIFCGLLWRGWGSEIYNRWSRGSYVIFGYGAGGRIQFSLKKCLSLRGGLGGGGVAKGTKSISFITDIRNELVLVPVACDNKTGVSVKRRQICKLS